MNNNREELEKEALSKCEAELYYDLADEIGVASDMELKKIIEEADKELATFKGEL